MAREVPHQLDKFVSKLVIVTFSCNGEIVKLGVIGNYNPGLKITSSALDQQSH